MSQQPQVSSGIASYIPVSSDNHCTIEDIDKSLPKHLASSPCFVRDILPGPTPGPTHRNKINYI